MAYARRIELSSTATGSAQLQDYLQQVQMEIEHTQMLLLLTQLKNKITPNLPSEYLFIKKSDQNLDVSNLCKELQAYVDKL